jgi:EPS-associated MarR family transcriptional regulator
MSSKQTQSQEDTAFRLMHLIALSPEVTQRELADQLGVSVGRLNYCLKALMNRGWVKMQNFGNSKHKLGYMYLLTPLGLSEKTALTGRFLKRKLVEYDSLKKEIESISHYSKLPEIENKAQTSHTVSEST